MTPTILQDCMVDDFKQELSGIQLKNSNGQIVDLNIYPQNLPSKKNQNDTNHFPYIVVRVMDGEDTSEDNDNTCKIAFIIGVYDDTDNYQGYKDVMNLIEKIKRRLYTKRIYNNQFTIDYPFKWTIYDDDTYPYYFGGIETHWIMPKLQIDDELI